MTKQSYKQFMLSYLHKPYIWGGDDPISGLDCSGLIQELLSPLGLDPKGDQTADAIYRLFNLNYPAGEGEVETGALVFYGSESFISHVGMIFEGNVMLEAGGGGSKVLTTQDAIKQNAYIRLRLYTRRLDLVKIISPLIKWTPE